MQGKTKIAVMVASVLAIVAIIIGVIFFATNGATTEAESTTPPTGAPTSTTSEGESVCGLTARTDTNDIETTAPETEWEWVDAGFLTAQNDTHGPGVVQDNGVRYCYARTPTGALNAAYNAVTMGALFPHSEFAAFVIVAGAVQEEMAASDTQPTPEGGTSEPAAFRITGYDGTNVSLDLVVENSDRLITVTFEMRWEQGDWRLVPLSNGQIMLNRAVIDSLAGYVPWGPRG